MQLKEGVLSFPHDCMSETSTVGLNNISYISILLSCSSVAQYVIQCLNTVVILFGIVYGLFNCTILLQGSLCIFFYL